MNCIQLLDYDTELIVLKYLKQRRHYYQFYKPILCKTIGSFKEEYNYWDIRSQYSISKKTLEADNFINDSLELFKFLMYNKHMLFSWEIEEPIRGKLYIRKIQSTTQFHNNRENKDKKYNTIYNLRKCIKNNNEIICRIQKDNNISDYQKNQALKFYRMSNTYLKIKTQLKIRNYWSPNGSVNIDMKRTKYRKCYTNHRLWNRYSRGKEDYRFTPRDFKTMNNNLDKNINKKTSDYIINGPYYTVQEPEPEL